MRVTFDRGVIAAVRQLPNLAFPVPSPFAELCKAVMKPISYPEQCLFAGWGWHWLWGNGMRFVISLAVVRSIT